LTFSGVGSAPHPTPNLEDQVSIFISPGDWVAQLYTQAPNTHFSRLLRHIWATLGVFFSPVTTRGHRTPQHRKTRTHLIPWVGFETTIPVFKRPKTVRASDLRPLSQAVSRPKIYYWTGTSTLIPWSGSEWLLTVAEK
jgi:hypothetical protein